MEDELLLQKTLGNLIYPYETARIPYRDWDLGWDDWPPIYAAMYPIYHGAYGHTIETWSEEIHGVDADYAVVRGALNYTVANKKEMIKCSKLKRQTRTTWAQWTGRRWIGWWSRAFMPAAPIFVLN
jgi:hypothetical protein